MEVKTDVRRENTDVRWVGLRLLPKKFYNIGPRLKRLAWEKHSGSIFVPKKRCFMRSSPEGRSLEFGSGLEPGLVGGQDVVQVLEIQMTHFQQVTRTWKKARTVACIIKIF
jgi:hypothetical protein